MMAPSRWDHFRAIVGMFVGPLLDLASLLEDHVTVGGLLALLVIVAVLVLFLIGRLGGEHAALFGALALAVLLSAWPIFRPAAG